MASCVSKECSKDAKKVCAKDNKKDCDKEVKVKVINILKLPQK